VCGRVNVSPVWRVLDQRERADALQADAPGLVAVACDGCGAARTVDDALLLVRITTIAPVVMVLSWEQLQEPSAAVAELYEGAGDQVLGEPVLAPRLLLPLLLTRDLDADVSDRGRAVAEVRAQHGGDIGDAFDYFLTLAVDQYAEAEPRRLLDAFQEVPVDQLPGWMEEHPQASGPNVLALLDRSAERADAAGDKGSAGLLRLMRKLLGAVAEGTPIASAVAAYELAAVAHFEAHLRPQHDRLWAVAQGTDVEAAIDALRELLARLAYPDPTGKRRIAAEMLASRRVSLAPPRLSVLR